ncbi:DUF2213 domain-containing protein [Listeria monocytogenes]|nr:DUF2213 domain-containing protein [Listeria monocytogenes]EAC2933469.1 DUF2213 domain-containing protein [Listeria monocytogenes]EAC4093207.1 DUF2213 domain-containing protein [Listeria monocytogenes]EAC5914148.1 DUF2213 domain-containing protein [Listeria monocytogenes]EAD1768328.1 DUF2213 domain-containing protein [Listeria monocytogenes]
MRVQRYDKSFIADSNMQVTKEGYLTVKAPVTRPGVFPYQRADGGIQLEAKLPENLFSGETIQSLNAKPVTNDHPAEPVNASNHQKYAKGTTHTDACVSDNKLFVSFTITDSKTIQAVQDGKRELSLGFESEVVKESGTYAGERYDAVQKSVLINHLAIVDEGRVGPEIAIRGDSAAFMIDAKNTKEEEGGNMNMTTLKIDSKEYEVDSVVKSRFDALEAKLDAANAKVAQVDTLEGERDGLKTKLDKAESDLAEANKKAMTEEEIENAVTERAALLDSAKVMLGDSFDFKGKTAREIKEAAIKTSNDSFDSKDKSDEYVNAFYDAMTVTADAKGYTADANFSKGKPTAKELEEIEKKKAARQNFTKKGVNE